MPKNMVALGTFDGLHIGHKAVLNQILNKGGSPIALTFNLPPKASECKNLLMTPEEKITAMQRLGIKVVVLDFEKIKNLTATQFLTDIAKEYNPSVIASGFNFRFGKNALGSTDDLQAFCNENGIEFCLAKAVLSGDMPVSSTRIRQAVLNGEIALANQMLGRRFCYTAPVLHGDERGRVLGFPTINQLYPEIMVKPKYGVYASLTEIDGKIYKSVTDIGIRPTFKTDYTISETNIFDFDKSVYGKTAKVYLVDFIRAEQRFASVENLKNSIDNDKQKALEILKSV